jgi:hypothetical protein
MRSGRPRLHVVRERPGEPALLGGRFDWREELELVAPDVTLPPGCTAQAITAAEGSLGLTFPREQVEFLKATDGVYDAESHHWFAWSLERLVDENFEPDTPTGMLVVGDDAASGWFCVPLAGNGVRYYERTTGQSRTVAADLSSLWLGWFGGTLRV